MLWRQFRYYSNTADLSSRSSHRWSTIGPFPRTSEPRIGSTLWLHDMWHVTCTCVGVIVSDILCGVDVIAHNLLNCCTWSVHMSTCQMYSNVAYELHYIVIRGMSSYVRAAGPYSWNDHAMQPSFLVHWHTGQDSGILRTQCLPSGRWTNVCCQKYVKNSKDISLVSPRCFANMSALHRTNSNHVPQPRAEISASARSQVGLSQRVSTGQRDLTYFKMASMNWSLALCKGTTVAFKN